MKQEPAAIIGTITAAATAIIALLVAFGADLTQQQQTAILGVVAVAAPVIAGVLIRFNVYAPATVKQEKTTAYRAGLAARPMDDVEAVLQGRG